MNWLAKFAEAEQTDAQVLASVIDSLSSEEIRSLSRDLDLAPRPTQVANMQEKIAAAHRMGIELAHEQSRTKEAMLPALIGGVARMAAGSAVKSGIGSAVGGALKATAGSPSVTGAVGGGFKYAGVMADVGRQAAGFVHRNPGAALTAGGAAVGAVMAPRDSQTGEKQVLRGAMMGGGLAAGANALSKGRIADKGLKMVTRQQNPVLGQDARRYMIESAKMTRPGASAAPSQAPAAMAELKKMPPPTPTPGAASSNMAPNWSAAHAGAQGMQEAGQLQHQLGTPALPAPQSAVQRTGGGFSFKGPHDPNQPWANAKVAALASYIEKLANRQSLTYDPATKTFTRQHMEPSTGGEAMMGAGAAPIQAGHTEPVRNNMTHSGFAPYGSREYFQNRLQRAQAGQIQQGASSIPTSTSIGSSAATGVQRAAPRPMAAAPQMPTRPMAPTGATPPPIPAAAMKPKMPLGGPAGLAGAAAKPKLPGMGGALGGALAGGLKKIATKR